MSDIIRAMKNCFNVRCFSLKLFKFFYKEVPFEVKMSCDEHTMCSIWYYNRTGMFEIELGNRLSKIEKLTGLLHEVGHYKDYKKLKNYNMLIYMNSENQEKRREKRAWKEAIRFSDKYKIPIDFKVAKEWLATYDTSYKVLCNRSKSQ